MQFKAGVDIERALDQVSPVHEEGEKIGERRISSARLLIHRREAEEHRVLQGESSLCPSASVVIFCGEIRPR